MARRVRQHHGQRPAGQGVDHRCPGRPALGEAVEQHQGWPSRPGPFGGVDERADSPMYAAT